MCSANLRENKGTYVRCMYVDERNIKAHCFLHHVNGEGRQWGLDWLLVCRVPSSTGAGLGCVSAALNPGLVAKGKMSSRWKTL